MNQHDAHMAYVEMLRLGAAGEADAQAARSRQRARWVAAVQEAAAAAGVYLIMLVLAYLLAGAL